MVENSILYSGKPPIFEDKEMFRLTIPLNRDKNYNENELKKLVENEMNGSINGSLNSEDLKVLEIIKNNPFITAKQMCKDAKISERKFYRIYNKLKNLNYIERIGSRKNGSWKIIKRN